MLELPDLALPSGAENGYPFAAVFTSNLRRLGAVSSTVFNFEPLPLRTPGSRGHAMRTFLSIATAGLLLSLLPAPAAAQVNGAGEKPYLGWSTFSEQTVNGSFLTQANIQAQSDALKASGLEEHGFRYINIDSGWQGSFDANYPILGTSYHTQDIVVMPLAKGNAFAGPLPNPYHDKIDFTKPGAQQYINSVVDLFASWGIDFIKLDGVTPGSYVNDLSIDNRPDVKAWSKAIAQSGRPIWLTISWQLDQDYLDVWQQYPNGRRTDDVV